MLHHDGHIRLNQGRVFGAVWVRSGSLSALNRTCFERRAGTVTRYGPAGSRSEKKTVMSSPIIPQETAERCTGTGFASMPVCRLEN